VTRHRVLQGDGKLLHGKPRKQSSPLFRDAGERWVQRKVAAR
jgi:hypothetical protein